MPQIQIEITNIAQIRRAFSSSPVLMVKELNTAIRQTVLSVGAQSRRNTPVNTGRLRASTYERFGSLRGEVGTDVFYDRFVHDGTRYMRGRPYLADAVSHNESNTEKYFTRAVDRVLEAIGRAT